ncbi:MAG TPA: glycosyltransferase family 2 protein, partial [Pirellulales bacterium]|nr:glycosyltransferase family 2 protein [Pirellulales bacterium]
STDRSEAILRRELPRGDTRLINMSRNFGVSPCVLAGMLHAQGDAVVYLDADLQDPPELLPQLVKVWKSQPDVDVVHTVRRSRAGETRLKLAITRLGYRILRMVSTIDLPLEAGDFKLLSRRAVNLVTQFQEKRPFLRGLVCWIGFKQERVFYDRQPRHSGKTKFRVLGLKVIRNFIDSAVVSFSDVPLKLATALGLTFSAAAFVYLLWMLLAWLGGREVAGWSATLVAVLFLGGVQLVSVGVLGTYIASIFLETKGRPNFIIRECAGFDSPPEE